MILRVIYLLIFCSSIPSLAFAEAKKIRVQGGIAPIENIFGKIKEPFAKDTGIQLELKESSSESALIALENGETDLAVTGVPWEGIQDLLKKANLKLKNEKLFQARSIGRDLRIILVNKKLNVKSLSKEQLAMIATGQVKNWKEVGGADFPIQIIFAEKSPGLYQFWKKAVMDGKEFAMENSLKVEDLAAAKKIIAEKPGAYTIAPSSIKIEGDIMSPEIPALGAALQAYTIGEPKEDILKLFQYISGPGMKYIGK